MSKATLWEIPHYQVQVQLLSRCYKSLLIWVSPGSTLNARPIHPVLHRGPALPPHCPLLYAFIPFVNQNSCLFLFGLIEIFMIKHLLFCETLSCSTGRMNQFLSAVLESCCFSRMLFALHSSAVRLPGDCDSRMWQFPLRSSHMSFLTAQSAPMCSPPPESLLLSGP